MPILQMVIYTVEEKWKPWANTVAYYTLDTDFNDYSWNNRSLTNSWATITSLSWVDCAYYNGSSYSQYSGYTLWNTARTINVRVKCTWWGYQWLVHIAKYDWTYGGSLWIKFNNWNTNVWPWDWTNASAETVTANVSAWNWHNVVVTQETTTTKLYVDGTLIWTITSYPTQSSIPDGWALWSKFSSSHSEKLTWYLSKVILEDKVRTAQEISDYYNLTKWNYWL
jgi:hypothetical protein